MTNNPDLWFFQLIHLAILGLMVVMGLIKGICMAIQFLKGSSRMHDAMVQRLMRCPMVFFDTTPAGRILNRFTKDLDESNGNTNNYTSNPRYLQ